jgi:hypothetical protein
MAATPLNKGTENYLLSRWVLNVFPLLTMHTMVGMSHCYKKFVM